MVENFEEITSELTDYEQKTLLPIVIKGLLTKKGEINAITSTEIVSKLKGLNYKIDSARVRKLVNFIRTNNLIYNLIATSKGYYIASSENECRSFIRSLDQRINSIITVRDAMAYQLEMTLKNESIK